MNIEQNLEPIKVKIPKKYKAKPSQKDNESYNEIIQKSVTFQHQEELNQDLEKNQIHLFNQIKRILLNL